MDKYQQLENRIKELEKWKAEKTKQQISFPLDIQSVDILNKYYMRIVDTVTYAAGVGASLFTIYLGKFGNTDFEVYPVSLVSYTVNVATNYLTTSQSNGNLKFFNNQTVAVYTTEDGTPPSPLTAGGLATYHVINSDGYTFQLSATSGGAAIDITTQGVDRQFINYV